MAESRIIHGFHAVTARIRQNADSVLEVFVDTQRKDPRARDCSSWPRATAYASFKWTANASTEWPEMPVIRALRPG